MAVVGGGGGRGGGGDKTNFKLQFSPSIKIQDKLANTQKKHLSL